MSHSISILILAAGASTRMKGDIKQLLPWGATTLLENAVSQAKKVSDDVFVVLGANAQRILDSTSMGVDIIQNHEWESGMGSSISCGVKHIIHKEEPKAILIMLADQPLIDAAFLLELIKGFNHNQGKVKITATAYENGAGVPAIFDNSLFQELLDLQADFGARKVIKRHRLSTNLIIPDGKEIDIDTTDKYTQISGKQIFKDE
ncbi:nucleotidyltransferase family protein [Flagellimonas sp.]|uniref:nucleotidyltransferase family protein n=1 Tax=Flagellimonas sp. TaxID=2058762 RepID=UPI003B5C643B